MIGTEIAEWMIDYKLKGGALAYLQLLIIRNSWL
jgi:hypothetical protein